MKVLNPQSDALRDAIKKTGARLVANMFLIPIYEVDSVGTHGSKTIWITTEDQFDGHHSEESPETAN